MKPSGVAGEKPPTATNDFGSPGLKDQKGLEERNNRRNREERPPFQSNNTGGGFGAENDGDTRVRQNRTGGFRGGRGGGGFAGRGGSRGVRSDNRDTRGKPVFDRHSGNDKTGIKPVEKKDGGGAHNWGTINDELEGQVATDETQAGDRSGDETAGETTELQ